MRYLSIVRPLLWAPLVFPALSTSSTPLAPSKRDLISGILNGIKDTTTCAGCNSLLLVLQALAHTGNDNFVKVITEVCKATKKEDPDVCAGAIGLEGPILAHDLRQMTIGTKTADLFCLTVFGLCQWPAVDTSFSLPLSSKPSTSRPVSSNKAPVKVVHISDIHIDLNYTVGASYNCTKNICCRPYTADDEPGVSAYPAGPYGNSACDTPLSLETSMYAAIQSLVPSRAFSIFTGDVVEGAVWLVTDNEVILDLQNANSHMDSLGQVYPVMGNHDVSPVNSFPPPTVDTTISTQYAYDTLSNAWSSWIGAAAATEVSTNFGSYSTLTASGLRIISLNTNFWYKQNFWLYEKTMEHDPSGMLSWLAAQLEAAEAAGERVWLLGHMPMGASDAFHDQSYYFDTIIQRFDATIAAIFYGHTHKDEFEIAYSDYTKQSASTASMMSYIAPALTPTSGNPTFRVYDVDPVTHGILDMHVYYANLSDPSYQASGPRWELLYSVKDTYGTRLGYTDPSAELTPAFWHNVTALFENNDDVFQEYVSLKNRKSGNGACTGDCKTNEICQLRAAQSQYNCGIVSPGINFKRDVVAGSVTTAGECDGSRAVPILTGLLGADGIANLRAGLVDVLGEAFLDTAVPSNSTAS
ncbi:calcineurin-like phosphoesterase [Microdochium bolleyi]|uniref:Sphingomyelin phosphodiesterase n=1 Tax=Microdochium bolleyi TaxID=196109 RepID=A0A136ITG1_9PEZI|nr:calcineurin-like phosphoesterase [Microdochium bolleyi]